MLESNLSAIQGLRSEGRARDNLHPPQLQILLHSGKLKAKNSMPKLRFGGHALLREFLAHLALYDNLVRTVDEPDTNRIGGDFV